jgi:hypothetical protein
MVDIQLLGANLYNIFLLKLNLKRMVKDPTLKTKIILRKPLVLQLKENLKAETSIYYVTIPTRRKYRRKDFSR